MSLPSFLFPLICLSIVAASVAAETRVPAPDLTPRESLLHRPMTLQPVRAFDSISDPTARSVALFQEAGKVITHPRCMNCHPKDGRPTQGLDSHPHNPPIWTYPDGHGVAGLRCQSCHGARNFAVGGIDTRTVPGNPKWALAPASMAWQGKTLGEICRQIRDPARNGGRSLTALHDHMAHDALVGWGWSPGEGRAPAPGSQAVFGALIKAWIDSGAACPA